MALTFGTYPHPGFSDRLITNKPEGTGWNNLGPRQPFAIVLHRMLGTLWGTDAYFRDPNVAALTDYGLGVEATDGKANAGVILRWCDPNGTMTPWASGPVSAPYGDGLCFVQASGNVNAANKHCVSIEISGQQETPIDDFAYGELVKLCAYWCDQMAVPFNSLTNNPETGCSAFIWHEEFTYGTGKKCPFDVVKRLTDQLIEDTSLALAPYQEGSVSPEPPTPEPPPEPSTSLLPLPAGMSWELVARNYGQYNSEWGTTYQWDEGRAPCQVWYNEACRSIPAGGTYEDAAWPPLVKVIRRGDKTRCQFQWSDGSVYEAGC
jgi:hypothetical protein